MSCSGLAKVLSGVALICEPRRGRLSRFDHTVIDPGYHRLPIGTISGVSVNDCSRRSADPSQHKVGRSSRLAERKPVIQAEGRQKVLRAAANLDLGRKFLASRAPRVAGGSRGEQGGG